MPAAVTISQVLVFVMFSNTLLELRTKFFEFVMEIYDCFGEKYYPTKWKPWFILSQKYLP